MFPFVFTTYSESPDTIRISRPKISKRDLKKQLKAEKQRIALMTEEIKKLREENDMLRKASIDSVDTPNSNRAVVEPDGKCLPSDIQGTASSEGPKHLSSVHQLSVSALNIPECKPEMEGEGIQRHAFEMWRDLLVDSLKLFAIQDEPTMYNVFKVRAGQQLLQIFKNTKSDATAPDADLFPFSNAMHRLKSYFSSGSDIMLQRRKLATMDQKSSESDLSYIGRVGATARLCDFEDGKEFEQIVSTIAEHALRKDVRALALKMLSRKATYTDLVDKIRELEAIRLNEDFFMKKKVASEPKHVAPVRADFPRNARLPDRRAQQTYPTRSYNRSMIGGARPHFDRGYRGRREPGRNFTPSRANRCWRCHSVFHAPADCDAAEKVCRNCGIMGHLARACSQNFPVSASSRKRFVESSQEEEPRSKLAAIEAPSSEIIAKEEVSATTEM